MATFEKRILNDGGVSYRVKIRKKGFPPVNETFTRLTDAKAWASTLEAQIIEGRFLPKTETTKHSIIEGIDIYLAHMKFKNSRRYVEILPMLNWWANQIGDVLLCNVTKGMIVQKRTVLEVEQVKLVLITLCCVQRINVPAVGDDHLRP